MADATLRFDTKLDTGKLESGLRTVGNLMTNSFNIGAAAIGTASAAIAGLSVKALQLKGDLEQSVGGIETLFKGSAETVIANAEKAYITAGVNANSYMQQVTSFSASLLQSLEGDTEKAAAVADMAIIDMADNANKMGSTIESIQDAYQGFAKDNYTMLDNLKLGYGGTKTEMERLLVDAEKLSGIKYDISNLNDVYQAIHVIQTELGITGTTSKEAMSTLTGALGTAKAALSNFLSGAGDIDILTESVTNAANIVVENLQELLPRLADGLPKVFSALGQTIPPLFETLLPTVVDGAITLISGMATALYDNREIIVQSAADIGGAILEGIFGEDIKVHWGKFVEDITASFKTFADAVEVIIKPVGATIEGLFKFILDNGSLVVATITGITAAMAAMNVASALSSTAKLYTEVTEHLVTYGKVLNNHNLIAAASVVIEKAKATATMLSSGQMTIQGARIAMCTAAQTAWNVATAAFPGVAIALAIGAVIAGLVLLVNHLNKINAETQAYIETTENFVKSIEDLNTAVSESADRFTEQTKSYEQNKTIADDLMVKIRELSEVEQRSAEQKAELANYVGQLNALYPDLNLNYSQENDLLSMTTDEIDAQLVSRQALIEMKAIEERQIELAKERLELEQRMAEAAEVQTEAVAKLKEETSYYTDEYGRQHEVVSKAGQEIEKVIHANATAFGEMSDALEANKEESEKLTQSYSDKNKAVTAATKAAEEHTAQSEESSEVTALETKKIKELTSSLESAESQYQDVASAQELSATSAADLMMEYSDLISSNSELLSQYPELYAALDENNSVQENGAAIAEAVWRIKKQLLINELEQQAATVAANIKSLESQRDIAVATYRDIANAAAEAMSMSALSGIMASKGEIDNIDAAIADAKNQLGSLKTLTEGIRAQELPPIEIKTSGGGKSGSAAKSVKDAFDVAKDAIKDYQDTADYTLQGELEKWQELQSRYAEGSKQRIEIDKNVRNLKEKIDKDSFDTSKKWIDEEKFYNRMSLEEELEAWKQIQEQYAEGSEQRAEAAKEIYTLTQEINKKQYDDFKKWKDNEKFYNRLTLQDELTAWKTVMATYELGDEERAEAAKEIYTLQKEINAQILEDAKNLISDKKYYNQLSTEEELEMYLQIREAYADNADVVKDLDKEVYRLRKELAEEDIQRKIDLLSDLKYKEVDVATSIRDTKMSLIDDETLAKIAGVDESHAAFLRASNEEIQRIIDIIRLTDEDTANQLQAIEDRKQALQAEAEQDKENRRLKNEAKQMDRLLDAIEKAETDEQYKKAYQDLLDFEEQRAQEARERERDAELKSLDAQKTAVLKNSEEMYTEQTMLYNAELDKREEANNAYIEGLKGQKADVGINIETPELGEINLDTNALQDAGKEVNESISTGIVDNLDMLVEPATEIIDTTIDSMKESLSQLEDFTAAMYAELLSGIEDRPWHNVGYNLIMGMVRGVYEAMQPLIDAVVSDIRAALAAARAELEIASPSKKTMSDGVNWILGYVAGIEKAEPVLLDTINGISTDMLSMPLSALSEGYTAQLGLASAGADQTQQIVNQYYIYPQKMSYSDREQFMGEVSRAIARGGV